MAVKFTVDYTAIEKLSEAILKLPNKAEKVINKTLLEESSKQIAEGITPLIPISRDRKGNGIRDKIHARNVNWHSKEQKENLTITAKTKGGAANKRGSYGYLVFPNEGRGKYNPKDLEFMEKGRDKKLPEVIDGIESNLIKTIEEELK